jgi:hypothetical protein
MKILALFCSGASAVRRHPFGAKRLLPSRIDEVGRGKPSLRGRSRQKSIAQPGQVRRGLSAPKGRPSNPFNRDHQDEQDF